MAPAPVDPNRVRRLVRDHLTARLGGGSAPAATAPARRPLVDERTILAAPQGQPFVVPGDAMVTPLARDAARERGIRLTESSPPPAAHALTGAPDKRVAIGADHGGVTLKTALVGHLKESGYEVLDIGPHDEGSVDYPDYALAVARLVADGTVAAGIMIDGVGIGSAMAANKVQGVRAGLCYDVSTARNAREHNHANVLTLGGQFVGPLLARQIVTAWLETPFGGGRHARRVAKIDQIGQRYGRDPQE